MVDIRWHGRGGQGAFTASKILGAAAIAEGKYALSFPSFGPERRGAPIQAFTKIDKEPITDRTVVRKCDYIIFLDETLVSEDVKNEVADLKPNGKIYINTKVPDKYLKSDQLSKLIVTFDADTIATEILGRAVSNTAMLTVAACASDIVKCESLKAAIPLYLQEKIAKKNICVIDAVFEAIAKMNMKN